MPPKAKADTAGYQKLKKDLSAGTPGQLYLLHGEETYLRDYYLGRLREKVLAGGLEEFNFHPIAAKDMSPHALEEAIDCLPMMAERTLVQVTDFDLFKAGEKDREAYGKLLSQLPDYVCLVFVFDLVPFKMDARTKFSAVIKQAGTVVNFVRQDQGDLVDWVRRRFRALGKDIDSKLVVKLPTTAEGLKACRVLSGEGIKTNLTLIFNVPQAILAARAGATYVSPFVGRIDDISMDGLQLIRDIAAIFKTHDIKAQIISASVRNACHVIECAKAGADLATVPYSVIEQMLKHPLTAEGIEKFQKDYRAVFGG